jgi:hypothetical protein
MRGGRFDILVTEICFVILICHVIDLQMIQCLFKNAKHCVVNTLEFKYFRVDSIFQTLYRFELLEG